MSHFGKLYTFDKEDNFSNYIDSLKIPSSEMAARLSAKRKFKLEKNGDTYTFFTQNIDGTDVHTFNFKSGDVIERKVNADKTIKIIFKVEGNSLIEQVDSGSPRAITSIKEFTADSMKETLTTNFWDGTAYRYYKAE